MKKQILLILFLTLSYIFSVNAQIIEPVVWTYSTKKIKDNEVQLIIKAKIDTHWHLYSQFFPSGGPQRLNIKFNQSDKYTSVGKVKEITKPKTEHDDIFDMDIQYFEHNATLVQTIKVLSEKDFTISGSISGQACKESCVLINDDFEFNIKGVVKNEEAPKTEQTIKVIEDEDTNKIVIDSSELSVGNITQNTTNLDTSKVAVVSNSMSSITLENDSLWWLFWISFVAGLVAILTPCVFPMIPMTVSFFMKSGEDKVKGKFQAIFYGLSIIAIYTIIGTLISIIFGGDFAYWLSTHWIPNTLFFIIFMVFAASFFGMFEITLPNWLINKSDSQADKGGIWAPFFMAFTLVLVSFSCTGPLVGAILFESAGGLILKPIIGMFGFSLAFALPFTLFAFFPSWLNNLPKSGGWLNSVKVVLGFIEIALGFKFLSIADQTYSWGILDREIYLAIWIVLAILLGMYLLGKLKFAHDSELKFISVPRLSLAIVTFTFVVYLIPGMWGAPLKALSGYLPPMHTQDFNFAQIIRDNGSSVEHTEKPKYGNDLHLPHGIKGYYDYEQALKVAKKENKPVFIDFTGASCSNCRAMEEKVWSHPQILDMLKNDYVVVALYADSKIKLPENEWITSLRDGKIKKTLGAKNMDFQMTRFRTNSQPYYVLVDSDGKQLCKPRAYNENIKEFIKFLENGIKKYSE